MLTNIHINEKSLTLAPFITNGISDSTLIGTCSDNCRYIILDVNIFSTQNGYYFKRDENQKKTRRSERREEQTSNQNKLKYNDGS